MAVSVRLYFLPLRPTKIKQCSPLHHISQLNHRNKNNKQQLHVIYSTLYQHHSVSSRATTSSSSVSLYFYFFSVLDAKFCPCCRKNPLKNSKKWFNNAHKTNDIAKATCRIPPLFYVLEWAKISTKTKTK